MSENAAETTIPEPDPQASNARGPESATPTKKHRRRQPIALAVIAVVLVVAGAGFWVWHEQPSFCNAICHSPMDKYVESYHSNDDSLLVTAHAAEGDTCLDCHEPTIDQQIAEGAKWVTGDFKDPLPAMEYGDEFCLNEKCHNVTRGDLSALTENLPWNPHDNRHGMIDCSVCHQVHERSTLYCAQCHGEAVELAEEIGWNYQKE